MYININNIYIYIHTYINRYKYIVIYSDTVYVPCISSPLEGSTPTPTPKAAASKAKAKAKAKAKSQAAGVAEVVPKTMEELKTEIS